MEWMNNKTTYLELLGPKSGWHANTNRNQHTVAFLDGTATAQESGDENEDTDDDQRNCRSIAFCFE